MKTINLWTIAFFCFFSSGIHAQSLHWQWAKGSTKGHIAEGNAIATDTHGNIYETGTFDRDSICFGGSTIRRMANNLNGTLFLVKYSPAGQVLWATGSTLAIKEGVDIATDGSGHVYMACQRFGDAPNFLNPIACITKFDSLGQVLWSDTPSAGGMSSRALAISTDGQGNAYLTGQYFFPFITFGSDTVSSGTTVHSRIFMVKYSPSGQVLWARTMVSANEANSSTYSLANDAQGDVYIVGQCSSDSLTIDTIGLKVPSALFSGNFSFIAKYNGTGRALWARLICSNGYTTPNDITTDNNGNTYVITACFGDSAVAGQITSYGEGSLITKFDAQGTAIWSKFIHSLHSDRINAMSIAAAANGAIYISGSRLNSLIWGNTMVMDSTGPAIDRSFVMSIDPSGLLLCLQTLPLGGDDQNAVAVDPMGNAYFGGDYMDSVFIVGADTLRGGPQATECSFLAKFSSCGAIKEDIEILSENAALQIFPNPLSTSATVKYSLPNEFSRASLIITDVLGRERGAYPVSQREGEMNINASALNSGVYFYSLMVDGKTLTTKKMLVE